MKRILTLLIFLLCVVAKAQTVTVIYNFSNPQFGLAPATNLNVAIQAFSLPSANNASILVGPVFKTNTGATGIVTNVQAINLAYSVVLTEPTFGQVQGKFAILLTNNTGTVQAQSNLIAYPYGTQPAGSVSWAIASSDLRYAPISIALTNGAFLFGTNTWTGTNIFTNNTVFSNSITLNGGTITNWPTNLPQTVVSNVNGLTNGTQAFATGTSGSDFSIVSATGTHTFNLPVASGANSGKLSSADWTTFNGKQNALGFTPVPNTRNVNTTGPLTGGGPLSGDLTVSIPIATGAANGYLGSNDFVTFSNKIGSAVTVNVQSPLTGGGSITNLTIIAIPAATSTQSGYLTNTDWTNFNGKQQALTSVPTPLNLSGGTLTIQQADSSHNGYILSTDYTNFSKKQDGNNTLSNFVTLGTNYYQATNANLTQWQQQPTNNFVPATNGYAVGLTNSNTIVKGTWQAASGAVNGYVWTSDGSGNGTWQVGGSGGGATNGIQQNNGFGTNTTLTNALLNASTATNILTVLTSNVLQGTAAGLMLVNPTAPPLSPATNQNSPGLYLYGNSVVGGNATPTAVILQNRPQATRQAAVFSVADSNNGTLFTVGQNVGATVTATGVMASQPGLTVGNGLIKVSSDAGTGSNLVPYFDNQGQLQNAATTDMLPQGATNLWYSNSLVQAFSDVRYQRKSIKTVTANTTITTNDWTIICDTTGGSITNTLPGAASSTNLWIFKNLTSTPMVIATIGADHIEGGGFTFTNSIAGQSDIFQSDGVSNFRLLAEYMPTNRGSLSANNPSVFYSVGNDTIADSSTFPPAQVPGQMLMTYSPSIGGSTAGQLWFSGSDLTWRREEMFGRTVIYGNNGGFTADALFVKATNAVGNTNATDNVVSIQNQGSNGYNAMRWIDMNNNERGAIGGGQNPNVAFYQGNNYIEDNQNTSGFYFASKGFINGGLEKNTGHFVWYTGALGTNDASATKVVDIDTNGDAIFKGTLTVTNSSSFSSNKAAISTTGRFSSSPGTNFALANGFGGGQFVAGFANNIMDANAGGSAIVGGWTNTIRGFASYSAILGGTSNTIISAANNNGSNSVIIGGQGNTISNGNLAGFATSGRPSSVIVGGTNNLVTGDLSYAMGGNAVVTNTNSFVFNNANGSFATTSNGQFLINSTNGVGINTNNPGTNALSVFGGVAATSFAGDGSGITNVASMFRVNDSAYPLAWTNLGGQPDMLLLPIPANSQSNRGDFSIPIVIPDPFASTSGGLFFSMFTTNAHVGYTPWGILPSGQTNYLKDLKALQIGAVGEQAGVAGDVGAGEVGLFANPGFAFAIGAFNSGNENQWLWQDPTNWVIHFPMGNSSAAQDPRSNSWPDAVSINSTTGTLTTSNFVSSTPTFYQKGGYIGALGNISIGTTNAIASQNERLYVGAAGTSFGPSTNYAEIMIQSTSGNDGPNLRLSANGGHDYGLNSTGSGDGLGAGSMSIYDFNNSQYEWYIDSKGNMVVTNNSIVNVKPPTFVHTNTAPVNAVTPVLWIDVTNGGSVYKMPLYQ